MKEWLIAYVLNAHVGWFVANVVVPMIAPNVMLLLFVLLKKDIHQLAPIRDGQLCWAAVAFCASALHEVLIDPTRLGAFFVVAVLGLSILLATSAFIAGAGSVYPVDDFPRRSWHQYVLLKVSLVLTGLAAVLLAVVHFA